MTSALTLAGGPLTSCAVEHGAAAAESPESAVRSERLAELTRLLNEANRQAAAGNHAATIAKVQQAIPIQIEVFGKVHPDAAFLYDWLGNLQWTTGDYEAAAASFDHQSAILAALPDAKPRELFNARRAAADARRRAGFDAADWQRLAEAEALNGEVVAHYRAGEYAAAVVAAERALALHRDLLGDDHPNSAISRNNLAGLYQSMGEHARALPLLEQALATTRNNVGEDHPDTASSLNNLAYVHMQMGRYDRALPLYTKALAINRRLLGENHPNTAISLNNLALLHQLMGQYDRALPLYQQALATRQQTLGEDHPDTAVSLNNLACLYSLMGDNDRALPRYEQALALKRETLGENHPSTATALDNLAVFYSSMGEHSRALPLSQQALAIRQKTLGDDHPSTARALNNLAGLFSSTGDHARATALSEQALAINQRALGDEHPDTRAVLGNLALKHVAMGDTSRAWDLLLASAAAEREFLEGQLFSFGDAQVRAMLTTLSPEVDLLASLPHHAEGRTDQLLEVLLTSKAVAFEVLNLRRAVADLATTDEEAAQLRRSLVAARQTLERFALQPPPDATPGEIARRRTALREEIRRLDERLNQKLAAIVGADISLAVSLDQLRSAMAPGAVHIEYFHFRPYEFPAPGAELRCLPARYAAFVVSRDAATPVHFIDLGPAAEIEQLITKLGEHLEQFKRLADGLADEEQSEAEYREIAAALSSQLFAPIVTAVGDARQVTLGPDGRLHEIAFEALVDGSGQFLVESGYQFAYVNSGRDLLRKRGKLGSGVAVFARPDYAEGYDDRIAVAAALDGRDVLLAPANVAGASGPLDEGLSRGADTRRGWRDLGESALAEGQEAAAAFAEGALSPVATYVGGQALEEVVKRLNSPRVLVLITHGDFLENEPSTPRTASGTPLFLDSVDGRGGAGLARMGLRAVEDPFLRSYLVLAGANRIDEPIPDGVDVENGWLTAREIAELDLRGTDLVVLSACSTNRGDAQNGRAVMGMRSALLFAGARTIVGSLFEVPNAETRQLLRPFYEGVAAGQGKLASLNAAKLAFIKDRRAAYGAAHPFYWASFILVGEP